MTPEHINGLTEEGDWIGWMTPEDELEDIEIGLRASFELVVERIPYSSMSDRVKTMSLILHRRLAGGEQP